MYAIYFVIIGTHHAVKKLQQKEKIIKKEAWLSLFYNKKLEIILLVLNIRHHGAAEGFPYQKISLGLFFAIVFIGAGAILDHRIFYRTGSSENHQAGEYHHSYEK